MEHKEESTMMKLVLTLQVKEIYEDDESCLKDEKKLLQLKDQYE